MYNLGAYFGHRLKKKKSSLFLHSMPLVLSQVLIDGAFGDQGDSFAPQVTGAGYRLQVEKRYKIQTNFYRFPAPRGPGPPAKAFYGPSGWGSWRHFTVDTTLAVTHISAHLQDWHMLP
jgi:hypothetical protein